MHGKAATRFESSFLILALVAFGITPASAQRQLPPGGDADIPASNLREAIQDGQKVIQKRLASQATNVTEVVEQIVSAYDAQHPTDLWLDVLSMRQLQKLARERTNDLAPRLLLLPRELTSNEDCDNWFATLKEAYGLCSNEEQRVACLVLATGATWSLESKVFGKAMLGDLSQWLKNLSSPRLSPAVRDKIPYLQLAIALGTEAYADAPVYATGTSFRTLIPIWMMSKGNWELALREVQRLKQLPDLSNEEKSTLDFFESSLKDITRKKSGK
jgi:hypothetical protein